MFKTHFNRHAVSNSLSSIRHSLHDGKITLPPKNTTFVFLCGANISRNVVSTRRQAIIDFSRHALPHSSFFIAERALDVLQKESHNENLIDIEHRISQFADYILIVLESPSAFTELGAFSSKELRDKLIVINDSKHEDSTSFIHLGPLKALKDAQGHSRVIYYPMAPDGITYLDAVGETFATLSALLPPRVRRSTRLPPSDADPASHCTKSAALFLHDLIYIAGPIKHAEVIKLCRNVFDPDGSYNNVRILLGILVAFDAVTRCTEGLYRSTRSEPYLKYNLDINSIVAQFRTLHLKNNPERFYP
ncbi:retron St85 family effector protein [Thioalkalivibrio sp. ALMg3]|uniref:retron St85 family effector protein n=1 Tax=Thioalkalivibrio sp. ALMg3 TaxID=1158163 RepID=UPI00351083BE